MPCPLFYFWCRFSKASFLSPIFNIQTPYSVHFRMHVCTLSDIFFFVRFFLNFLKNHSQQSRCPSLFSLFTNKGTIKRNLSFFRMSACTVSVTLLFGSPCVYVCVCVRVYERVYEERNSLRCCSVRPVCMCACVCVCVRERVYEERYSSRCRSVRPVCVYVCILESTGVGWKDLQGARNMF